MIDTVEINFFSLNESEYALCNNHSSMKKKIVIDILIEINR